jgi:hypothetical protein
MFPLVQLAFTKGRWTPELTFMFLQSTNDQESYTM